MSLDNAISTKIYRYKEGSSHLLGEHRLVLNIHVHFEDYAYLVAISRHLKSTPIHLSNIELERGRCPVHTLNMS